VSSGHARAVFAALVASTSFGCDATRGELPPYGEALVVVDTDLPVPVAAARVRADFYDEAGRWYESRDIARPDPRDWPVSFGVFSRDESRPHHVWVRVRVYPAGATRDYRGERFRAWGGKIVDPAATDEPRIVKEGVDVTPKDEPLPLVTVDRLAYVRLVPGERRRVELVLRGACVGTMAHLGEAPILGEAETCVDTEKTLQVVSEQADAPPAAPSRVGSWSEPCAVVPADAAPSDRVCIDGGATILGSSELMVPPGLAATPVRTVYLPRFSIDRTEVSVARYRAAKARGFDPPKDPKNNSGDLGDDPYQDSSCTWSDAPHGREEYPVSCVSWNTARAFCAFEGGDLPTEAEWEHVATIAGKPYKSRFAWGDDAPSCDRAIYGRAALAGSPGVCETVGKGPRPIADSAGDVTPLGVVGMTGSMGEWVLDAYEDYASACWGDAPIRDTRCNEASPKERTVRGGAWAAPPSIIPSAARLGQGPTGQLPIQGFRCVYR
jgi:formylglycine-generating enzyme required for sulfatase activity